MSQPEFTTSHSRERRDYAPLVNGPIVMEPIPLRYIGSMTAAWYCTINCRLSIEEWLAKAEASRTEYAMMEEPGLVQGEDSDCEQGGEEDQQPWCGITCVRLLESLLKVCG